MRGCIVASESMEAVRACVTGEAESLAIPAPADVAAPPADAERSKRGVVSKVLKKGSGAVRPERQDRVTVHYTGWTTDGKMFDSSVSRGQPATFGLGQVIPGWTEGVGLMVVGEKRRLWIPAELAYADQADKPQGTLVFDVELLAIEPGPKPLPAPADPATPAADAKKEKSGIAWKTTRKGTGKQKPGPDAVVTVHYSAWASDGTMIQSSVQKNSPATIQSDMGVPAWKEMWPRMTAGQKVLVWAPADLAFKGAAISEGLTLFELELISFVDPPTTPKDVAKAPKNAKVEASGLASKVLAKGKGKVRPTLEDTVEVHYSGWTTDGKLFDSSVTRGKPARFPVKGVIPGWSEGVQLMVEGEKRRMWIPEDLAYKGQAGAPAGLLVFDVELIRINPPVPAE
jgi:FKBP-type peptidyl-prolyl cis-trans isomerase